MKQHQNALFIINIARIAIMRTIYLIRHAKSSWDDEDLEDFERPLNERGRNDAPEMGRRLKLAGVKPGIILSSPALRAIATARKIAEILNFPCQDILVDSKLYEASEKEILNAISKQNNELVSMLVIGHNPGMHLLCKKFGAVDLEYFPTCAIGGFRFDSDYWKDLEKMKGSMIYHDFPRKV